MTTNYSIKSWINVRISEECVDANDNEWKNKFTPIDYIIFSNLK